MSQNKKIIALGLEELYTIIDWANKAHVLPFNTQPNNFEKKLYKKLEEFYFKIYNNDSAGDNPYETTTDVQARLSQSLQKKHRRSHRKHVKPEKIPRRN